MMEVLGYQLIKLDSTHYDATVLAKYEKLEDILEACIEKGLDIVLYFFQIFFKNSYFFKTDLGGFEPPTLGSEVPRHNPD